MLKFTSFNNNQYKPYSNMVIANKKRGNRKKYSILAVGLFVMCGVALADYSLSDGTKIKWGGFDNKGKPTVYVNGVKTSAKFNRDGRAVPASGFSKNQRSETNKLGRQDVGGDSKYSHFKQTVPVYKDGKFTGRFANVFDDRPGSNEGLGKSYYTKGSEQGNWTNSRGDANWGGNRIDFNSGSDRPSRSRGGSSSYDPPPPPPTNILHSTSIEHNTSWEQIRTKNQRTQAQFYAGEKFVVKANTTTDATAVNVTFHFPQATKDVSPAFRESSESARPSFAATFPLSKTDSENWSGTLWKKSWAAIPDGTYTVTITSTFENGQTRTNTQSVQIQGSILDFMEGVEKLEQ